MQSRRINLGSDPFVIREWGDAKATPILLLHGFPEYSGAWDDLARALPDFRCIAPDQRGYGQSWCPEGVENYRLKHLITDAARLIETIGTPLILLGHDWGAAVAYGVAIARPDLVSKLIILNGVHPGPFQRALAAGGAQSKASAYINWLRRDGAETALAADGFRRLDNFFAEGMNMDWFTAGRRAEYHREWSRPGRLQAMVNWYRASPVQVADPGQPLPDAPVYAPDRFTVTMPHLLIWGDGDTALLPEAIEGLNAYAPNLIIRHIPDADHWLHHQHPQKVADSITGWLRST